MTGAQSSANDAAGEAVSAARAAAWVETNVRVPIAAMATLARIRTRRGFRSRDQTVRMLLAEYVADQQTRAPEDRLAHVATVMRYPVPPKYFKTFGHDDPGTPLRLRLPRELRDSARGMALKLPGQSSYRGHRTYQARLLTDAVLTAIAREEQIDDPMLGDHQLLTHRQGLGLFRLAVEATRTTPEKDAFGALEHAERELERRHGKLTGRSGRLVDELKERVAWHSMLRFYLVQRIVHAHLKGDDAGFALDVLEEQDYGHDDNNWLDLVDHVRAMLDPQGGYAAAGLEGRGATTVWRAERVLDIEDMISWIRHSGRPSEPRTHLLKHPGWELRLPEGWRPFLLERKENLPAQWSEHVQAGRVLHLIDGSKQILWPVVLDSTGTVQPVEGIEAVLTETSRYRAAEIIETLLLELSAGPGVEPPWWERGDEVERDRLSALRRRLIISTPAYVSWKLEMIDARTRDELVEAAKKEFSGRKVRRGGRLVRLESVDVILAEQHGRLDEARMRKAIQLAASDPRGLIQMLREIDADRYGHDFALAYPPGNWEVSSLADELVSGGSVPQLRWRSSYLLAARHRALNVAMNSKWLEGTDRYHLGQNQWRSTRLV